ncbi:MAG: conjugal transfer protein TraF [Cellvibrionaceae bacterium]|nr:conjugal transfer protein TraF [Cellvibrionaceae bacterium]
MLREIPARHFSALLLMLALSAECHAVSFLSFDANVMGLGGAGAVTGIGGDRPYLNPAVIADGESLAALETYVGARVIDRQKFIETFEEIEDNFDRLQLEKRFRSARQAFRGGKLDPAVLRELGVAAHQVLDEVNKLPDRYIRVAAAGGAHALGKHRTFAVGAFVHHYQVLSGVVRNDPEDLLRISRLADTAFSLADALQSAQQVEDLYRDVDWRGIEDMVRESLNSGHIDERLLAYQQLAGVQPLIEGLEQYLRDLGSADELPDAARLEMLALQVNWREIQNLIRQSADSWQPHEQLHDPRLIPGVQPLLDGIREFESNLVQLDRHVDIRALVAFVLDEGAAEEFDELDLTDVDLRNFLRYDIPQDLNSRIVYAGAEVVETGITFSLLPEALPGLSLGANLKQQEYSTIAYIQRVDEFERDEYKEEYTRIDHQFWNLDLGMTYSVAKYWAFGLAVKNVVRKEMKNRFGDTIILRPIARAGVAFGSDDVMVAVDVDITRNEPLGFDADNRYISLGSQFRFLHHQFIRLGYRHNMVDRTGMPAVGLGFGFKYGSFDIAATYSEKYSEAGVALQLGFMY